MLPHHIVAVEDEKVPSALIGLQRAIGHQEGVAVDPAHRQPHADEEPREERAVRVRQNAAHQQCPGRRIELWRYIFDRAAMRKTLFVGQADIDRHLVQVGEGQPVLIQVLANFEDLLLG